MAKKKAVRKRPTPNVQRPTSNEETEGLTPLGQRQRDKEIGKAVKVGQPK